MNIVSECQLSDVPIEEVIPYLSWPPQLSSYKPAFSATESGLTCSRTAFLKRNEGEEGGVRGVAVVPPMTG